MGALDLETSQNVWVQYQAIMSPKSRLEDTYTIVGHLSTMFKP